MNTHPKKAVLLAYLNEEVAPSQRKILCEHLAVCPACQKTLEAFSQVETRLKENLPALAEPARPSDLAWSQLQSQLPASREVSTIPTGGFSMKRSFAAALTVLVVFVSVLVAVPPVRAYIEEILFTYFHFELPNKQGAVGYGMDDEWPLIPYGFEYFPEGFEVRGVLGSINEAYPDFFRISSLFSSNDRFIKIIQSVGEGSGALPEGEEILINGHPAVLVRNPDVYEYLKGEVDNIADYAVYDTILLAWIEDGVRFEVVSNFPLDEVIKIAESAAPMQPGEFKDTD